jgi:hypothetical protein
MIKISILSRIHITKAERKKSKYTTHSFLLRKKKEKLDKQLPPAANTSSRKTKQSINWKVHSKQLRPLPKK